MIHIKPYQPTDKIALRNYQLEAEQIPYTALPHEWLQEHTITSDQQRFCIWSDDNIVGFFVLDAGTDRTLYSDNPRAVLLRSMSVDSAHQGKGYAKAALAQKVLNHWLLNYFPQCNEIIFGVNHANHNAIHFYRHCGFIDTGRTYMGIKGMQYIFSRSL